MMVRATRPVRRTFFFALACSLAIVLGACAPQSLAPTSPVPEPLSETMAMQGQLLLQYTTLQRMACLSSAAYVGADDYKDFCKNWTQGPNTTIQNFPITLVDMLGKPYDGYYIVLTDNLHKQQAIAIRGTADLQDWEANFHFEAIADEKLKVNVHEGFARYAKAVYDSLTKDNKDVLNAEYDIFLTGHSLGGAAAVLTGLYFYVEEPQRIKIKGVYTFGQPRVFDNRGATSWPDFARNVFHIENCYDPVPLVPVSDDFIHNFIINPLSTNLIRRQFQHMGHEILLLNPGEYWMPGGNEIVRNLESDLQVILQDLHRGYQTNHYIGTYINRIWALRGADGHGLPQPVNPAYDFGGHCVPNPST
jgi:predicted lipase